MVSEIKPDFLGVVSQTLSARTFFPKGKVAEFLAAQRVKARYDVAW